MVTMKMLRICRGRGKKRSEEGGERREVRKRERERKKERKREKERKRMNERMNEGEVIIEMKANDINKKKAHRLRKIG